MTYTFYSCSEEITSTMHRNIFLPINIPNAWSFIVIQIGSSFQNVNRSTCNKFLPNKPHRCKVMHMKYSVFTRVLRFPLDGSVDVSENPWDLIRITSAQYLNTSDAVQFSDDVNAAVQNKIKNTPFLFTSLRNDQLNYWFSFHIDRLLALPLLLITSVLFPPEQTKHPFIH